MHGDLNKTVLQHKWGFPKIRGTILGVPRIRIRIYWGLYWGTPILGNCQIEVMFLDAWHFGLGLQVAVL